MNAAQWSSWVKKTSHPSVADIQHVWNAWAKSGGWVYVAKVGEREGVWKVGKTGRANPFERVFALQKAVSATESFDLVWASLFVNRHDAETDIHKKMKRLGMHRTKEFFEGPLEQVIQCMRGYEEDERLRWSGWNIEGWKSGMDPVLWASQAFDWDTWWDAQERLEW